MSGGGMGQGGGRRMGRGGQGGGGRGMGRGGRMGQGGGMPAGYGMPGYPQQAPGYPSPQPGYPPPQQDPYAQMPQADMTAEQEIEMLEADMKMIQARIQELKQYGNVPPVCADVIEDRCTGCGTCAQVCPAGAVTVDGTAGVNTELCNACGICVGSCPQGAIILKKR